MFSLPLVGFVATASVQLTSTGTWCIVSHPDRKQTTEKSTLTVRDYRPFNYIEPVGGLRVRVPDDQGRIQRVLFFPTDVSSLNSRQENVVRSAVVGNRRYQVEGHTDEVGSREYNRRLSEARAKSVSTVLRQAGAAAVQVKAFGETQPVCREHTEGCHSRNRRVVIRVREEK